jgi:nucleotide-binding universal stress UspA family protein
LTGVSAPALIQRLCPGQPAVPTAAGGGLEAQLVHALAATGERFIDVAAPYGDRVRWVCHRLPAVDALELEADGADLCVVSPSYVWPPGPPMARALRQVASLGRPVLIAPVGQMRVGVSRVALLWDDSAACRRAMLDALPFLTRAEETLVVRFCARADLPRAERRLDQVCAGLAARGVVAKPLIQPQDAGIGELTADLATRRELDLVVAGAFGSPPLRRTLSGSHTLDLINASVAPLLLSR